MCACTHHAGLVSRKGESKRWQWEWTGLCGYWYEHGLLRMECLNTFDVACYLAMNVSRNTHTYTHRYIHTFKVLSLLNSLMVHCVAQITAVSTIYIHMYIQDKRRKYACNSLRVYVCVHKHTRFQFQNQGPELDLFTFRMLGMASGSMVKPMVQYL